MADENLEKISKLKELETTLARELDQQVNLAQPSDVRLSNSVALNPSLETAKIEEAPQELASKIDEPMLEIRPTNVVVTAPIGENAVGDQNKGSDDELSLTDVDDLLNDIDEGFKHSMDQIRSELGPMELETAGLESIPIGKDYLDEAAAGAGTDTVQKEDDDLAEEIMDELLVVDGPVGSRLKSSLQDFFAVSFQLPVKLGQELVKQIKLLKTENPKEIVFGLPGAVGPLVKEWLATLNEASSQLAHGIVEIEPLTYLKLFVLVGLMCGIAFLGHDLVKNFTADKAVDPYLRSFSEVAKEEQLVPVETGSAVEDPFKHPEFIVSLNRIVANLKSVSSRQNSMLAIEMYVEASNQDAAIEVHERELELKDLIERIAEQMTFDELDTLSGKEQFKSRVIVALNRILNRGRAKKIFFKNLQVKK